MSIADKLTYLNDTKSLLRESINAAGGNLTQETPFRDYAEGWLRDQSASLILDFSKQQYVAKDKVSMFPDRVGFQDIVTFTRSTGGGRFNAQGQYEWVGPDVPRIDYDPETGECRGLLIEDQRTNFIPWSRDLTQWGKGSAATVIPSSIPSPSGQLDAYQVLLPDGAGTPGRVDITVTSLTPEGTYTLSWYVFKESEDSNATTMVYGFDLGLTIVNTSTPISNAPVGRWARVSVTFTLPPGEMRISLRPVAGGYGSENLHFWGFQFEEGLFPTSCIPTDGAQVTRVADIATVNDLAPWYSPNQGSLSIKAKGHIGDPLLTVGDNSIIADSDEMKEYQVSYSEGPQATQVDIGKGLIESIRYWPRETE